jgi:hypothetical protein
MKFYSRLIMDSDKKGRPVYNEILGQVGPKKLLRVTTIERYVKYYVQEYERTLCVRFPACSIATGRKTCSFRYNNHRCSRHGMI